MKIGIIGGTFDPIHNGHLIMGEYARTALNLDRVIYIPVGIAPHKDNREITGWEKRIKMLELAIDSNSYFSLSLMEIDRGDISYTIDTIMELKEKYKNHKLYFIMGGDSVFEIENWKDSDKLIRLCNFAALGRGCKTKKEIDKKIIQLRFEKNMELEKIDSPIIEISSTEIRNRIETGLSIKYLVPESVEKYIKEERLYLGHEINE